MIHPTQNRLPCIALTAATLLIPLFPATDAKSCAPLRTPPPGGFPTTGATHVSTKTTLHIHSPKLPASVKVLAGSEEIPVTSVEEVGPISLTGGITRLWKVKADLKPSVLHVVSMADPEVTGKSLEVTRFTTASGFDQNPGTKPLLKTVQFWRVRYPVREIASGNCVFAEYHSFIKLDYSVVIHHRIFSTISTHNHT